LAGFVDGFPVVSALIVAPFARLFVGSAAGLLAVAVVSFAGLLTGFARDRLAGFVDGFPVVSALIVAPFASPFVGFAGGRLAGFAPLSFVDVAASFLAALLGVPFFAIPVSPFLGYDSMYNYCPQSRRNNPQGASKVPIP
jgi:hypothetical protein